jgi:hypothetical protein
MPLLNETKPRVSHLVESLLLLDLRSINVFEGTNDSPSNRSASRITLEVDTELPAVIKTNAIIECHAVTRAAHENHLVGSYGAGNYDFSPLPDLRHCRFFYKREKLWSL